MSNSTVRLPSLLAASMGQAYTGGDGSGEVPPVLVAAHSEDPVAAYTRVLSQLWLLGSPPAPSEAKHQRADINAARRLLAEQARLCDELGPEFAAAVGRQAARAWAEAWKRCPLCGQPGGHVGEPCL